MRWKVGRMRSEHPGITFWGGAPLVPERFRGQATTARRGIKCIERQPIRFQFAFNQVPILSSHGRRDHLGTSLTQLVLEEKQSRCTRDSSVRVSGQRAASGAMQASFSGRVLEGSLGHEEACWYSSPQSLLRFSPAPSPHI